MLASISRDLAGPCSEISMSGETTSTKGHSWETDAQVTEHTRQTYHQAQLDIVE